MGLRGWLGLSEKILPAPVAPVPASKMTVDAEPPVRTEPKNGILTDVFDELGISGTVNYDGRIIAEANPELRDSGARGTPGVGGSWGVWERIRRTDPAVESALNLVVAPLRDADLEVEPADVPNGELHAEYVKDNLTKWLDPQWSGFIQELVDGTLTSGFDIHEPVLGTRTDPRVPGGTGIFIAKLAQRLPSSLSMNPWKERGGELEFVVQQGQRSMPDGKMKFEAAVMLPADRILLTTWNRSGNNYEGFSALRSVRYLAKLREALLKIFAIGSEREALGIPVASVDKDAKLDAAQIEKWQKFLQNLAAHENAAAVPPPGMSFDWKFSPASNKGHVLDAWERLGKAIHMVFLTQQVTLGVDGTGSRAVGEVHDASKNEFIGGVKALIEGTLNGVGERPYTGIAQRIIIPNFGPQTAYPRIKLVMKRREVSAGELATSLPALKNAGVFTPRFEDENIVREKLGLPPIEEAEWDAEQERKAAAAATFEKPGTDPGGDEEDPKDEPGKKAPFPPKAKLSARGNPGAQFKRPLHPWEQHLDLRNLEATLNRQRDEFIENAGALLHAAIAEQVPAIKRQMVQADQSKPLDLPKLDLSKVSALVDDYIRTTQAEGYGSVAKERRNQPRYLSAGGERPIRLEEEDDRGDGTAPAVKPQDEAPPPEAPPQTSAARRVKAAQRIQRMRDGLITRLRARIISEAESEADYIVHQTNGDPDEIAENVVSRVLENRGLKFEAGSVQARTFSMGREEFAAEHASEISAVRYSALLDSNTCDPCAGMDGKEFEYGSPEHDAAVPPYGECKGGDQCRCLLIMIFKNDGFRPIEEAPEA